MFAVGRSTARPQPGPFRRVQRGRYPGHDYQPHVPVLQEPLREMAGRVSSSTGLHERLDVPPNLRHFLKMDAVEKAQHGRRGVVLKR